jgi:hypothetical protein
MMADKEKYRATKVQEVALSVHGKGAANQPPRL